MTEDLENILTVAFAPKPVEIRHHELVVACGSCLREMTRHYPVLLIPSESRHIVACFVGKVCECGREWSDPDMLLSRFEDVAPEERGFGYCLLCRQLIKLEKLAAMEPSGWRCSGCEEVAAIVAQIKETGEEGWIVPEDVAKVLESDPRAVVGSGAADAPQHLDSPVRAGMGGVERVLPRGELPRGELVSEPRYKTCCARAEVALPLLPDESIDSLVCDPPAGISFMGKDWDCFRRRHNPNDVGRDSVFGRTSAHAPHSYGESDRENFVAFLVPIFKECLRVLKPGAYGLVWSLPRTSHWTAWALEEAGFEIRDVVQHLFAQGFPKSHNVSVAIDKMLGAEREVVGSRSFGATSIKRETRVDLGYRPNQWELTSQSYAVTAPATPEAQQWEGWGTQLKPACEFWLLIQKPHKGTIAANVLTHGVGALNINACRIGRAEDDVPGWHQSGAKGSEGFLGEGFKIRDRDAEDIASRCGGKGRWPAHLVMSHSESCVLVGTRKVKGCPATVVQGGKDGGGYDPGSGDGTRRGVFEGYGDADGMEEVEEYACVPGCPVRLLDTQSGTRKSRKGKPRASQKPGEGWGMTATGAEYSDEGGISRFFYSPKPSKFEREEGLLGVVPCHKCGGLETMEHLDPEGQIDPKTGQVKMHRCLRNNHPTLKSVTLMRYLVRLITPPGGTCLDCFMGSGSTGVACLMEGFQFLGVEMEERSHMIARARLAWAVKEGE